MAASFSRSRVTDLLHGWDQGDEVALDRPMPVAYEEVRRVARPCMGRERPGRSLPATAPAHETYLRLIDIKKVRWQDRAHFFAKFARLMRRILVDHARAQRSLKRGAGRQKMSLDEAPLISPEPGQGVVALDEALETPAAVDRRKDQVFELRLRRVDRREDGRSAEGFRGRRATRLEAQPSVADVRDQGSYA